MQRTPVLWRSAQSNQSGYLALILSIAWACTPASSSTDGLEPPQISGVSIAPATITVISLGTQQFAGSLYYEDGSSALANLRWSATGGTISATGLLTAGSIEGAFLVIGTD